MRKLGVLFLLLSAVWGGILQARDALDDLSFAVDELEGCFWSGYFHASGHIRRVQSMAAADKVSRLSRVVQGKRKALNLPGIGNPTDPAMEIVMLLRSSSYAGEPVSVPPQKKMAWYAFMREFREKHRVKKGEKMPVPTRDQYESWLRKIGDINASSFSKSFRTGAKITRLRRSRLLGVEQRYRDALIALRLSIFDIRYNDPAFMPKDKTAK